MTKREKKEKKLMDIDNTVVISGRGGYGVVEKGTGWGCGDKWRCLEP